MRRWCEWGGMVFQILPVSSVVMPITSLQGFGFPLPDVPEMTLYQGKGCKKCRGTGYYGRCGVFEIFPMSDAIKEQVSVGIADFDPAYTIDDWFRPDAAAMMTVIEGETGGPIREIRMEAGERWNTAKYDEMNQAFQDKTMTELERLATGEAGIDVVLVDRVRSRARHRRSRCRRCRCRPSFPPR